MFLGNFNTCMHILYVFTYIVKTGILNQLLFLNSSLLKDLHYIFYPKHDLHLKNVGSNYS